MCLLEKTGKWRNGTIDVKAFGQLNDTEKAAMAECVKITGNGECDTAEKIMDCFFEKSIPVFEEFAREITIEDIVPMAINSI